MSAGLEVLHSCAGCGADVVVDADRVATTATVFCDACRRDPMHGNLTIAEVSWSWYDGEPDSNY